MTDLRSGPKPLGKDPQVTPLRGADFPSLYRSEFGYAWKTLLRLGVARRDLEDLTQDLFVIVYRHLADYDPQRPLRPWLFGIAVRVAADFRRRAHNVREVVGQVAAEPTDGAPPPDERLADAEARTLLMAALDGLDLERRAVFVMHELDEVPVPEIAAALAIPLNTAYSRLRLARADVVASIKRLQARGGWND